MKDITRDLAIRLTSVGSHAQVTLTVSMPPLCVGTDGHYATLRHSSLLLLDAWLGAGGPFAAARARVVDCPTGRVRCGGPVCSTAHT